MSKKNEEKGGEIGGRIRETQNAGRRDRERVKKGERIREGQRGEMKKKMDGERKKGGRERN